MYSGVPRCDFHLFQGRREVPGKAKVANLHDGRVAVVQQGVVKFQVPAQLFESGVHSISLRMLPSEPQSVPKISGSHSFFGQAAIH